jgi:hypothetical protein
LGSKENSELYAKMLQIPTIPNYYVGHISKLNIPKHINTFIIKPTNLNDSNGLLLIKNNICQTTNQKFNSNKEVIEFYKNKYSNLNFNVFCQKNISSTIRPTEVYVFTFNGITSLFALKNWKSVNQKEFSYYTPNLKLIQGNNTKIPDKIKSIISDSNNFSKLIKTFMRIDFLIDQNTGDYYFCETSTYPWCGRSLGLNVDNRLKNYWKYCFPFNKGNLNDIYNDSLKWNKKEKCEK